MAKGDIIGKCPLCGGDVVETDKAYGCSNWKDADGGCKMAIWKVTSGREVSEAEAKTLLVDGVTDVLDGFTSKAGKPFSAKLKLGENGRTTFEFPPKA